MKKFQTLFFILYAFLLFVVMGFHEPWEDELHAWILARELSIPQLFVHMRYEGHLCLWHLVLKPLAVSGCAVMFLNLASFLFCAAAAWVFLEKAPFRFLIKVLILFSFPLFYFFPAVARPYALIPLMLWGLAIFYPQRFRRPVLYAALIALIAQTHAYMAGFSAILTLIWCYELFRMRHHSTQESRKRCALSIGIIAVSALLALYQTLPAFANSVNAPSGSLILNRLAGSWNELMQFPGRFMKIITIYLGFIPGAVLLFGAVIAAGYLLFRCSKKVFLIFFVSLLWQLFFSICIYKMDLQRIYLPWLILIFCFWLTKEMKSCRKKEKMQRGGICIILLLALLTYPETLYYSVTDFLEPFSNMESTANFIQKNIDPKAKIFVFPPELLAGTFGAYLPDHTICSSADGKPFKYYLYDRNNHPKPQTLNDEILDRLTGNSREKFYILLQVGMVSIYHLDPRNISGWFQKYRIKLLYVPQNYSFFTAGEDYLILEVEQNR